MRNKITLETSVIGITNALYYSLLAEGPGLKLSFARGPFLRFYSADITVIKTSG
ncbi:MAG TPA: hypothetical protein VKN36_08605 [Eudoraea sp.]|nr:hypothetical protein [Eudoraea sp.]